LLIQIIITPPNHTYILFLQTQEQNPHPSTGYSFLENQLWTNLSKFKTNREEGIRHISHLYGLGKAMKHIPITKDTITAKKRLKIWNHV